MASPYSNNDVSTWGEVTAALLEEHPLKLDTILRTALKTWLLLWQTKIGNGEDAIRLDEVDPPATVIGYFFEKLYARELEVEFPKEWQGGRSKADKDLVCLTDPQFSIEMKSSGQLGTKVFGNRSYNQKAADGTQITKTEKSGYYITVNFHERSLTLIRFGWIDHDDWKPQSSSTGQSAILNDEVYQHKLVKIPGDYQLHAPVSILEGIGPKRHVVFAEEGVATIYDLLHYTGKNKTILKFKEQL